MSRSALRVLTEAICTSAVTVEVSIGRPTTTSAATSAKVPRTLVTIM